MQRIVLVSPQARHYSCNFSTNKAPGLLTAHSGLPILGELLRKKGYDVKIFDERAYPLEQADFERADLVGISMQTMDSLQGFRIGKWVGSHGIPVVFGGAHATLNPDECLDYGDFVVRNEGEETLPALIKALEEHKPLSGIAGLSYKENGLKVHNQQRPLLEDFDWVPSPNWNLIEGWNNVLLNPINQFVHFTQASRGCPFDCNFCSVVRIFGQGFRHRSVDYMIDEIKTRTHPSQIHLFFVDDNFVGDKDYAKALLEKMIQKNIRFPMGWHSQMRVDAVKDKELMDLIKRSGCHAATVGFESINPKTLKYMKKGQSVEDIKQAIKTFHDNEILVIGFWVVGSDEDDVSTIRETADFARESGLDIAGFMPMTPFPGTPFFKQLEREGRIFTKNWELFDVEHVVYFPNKMTPFDLYTETIKCYQRFYGLDGPVRNVWRMLRMKKNFTPFAHMVMLAWPIMKQMDFFTEKVANWEYAKLLKEVSRKGLEGINREEMENRFMKLSKGPFPLQDMLNMRGFKKGWRRVTGLPYAAHKMFLKNMAGRRDDFEVRERPAERKLRKDTETGKESVRKAGTSERNNSKIVSIGRGSR